MTLKVTYVVISLCTVIGGSFLPSPISHGFGIHNPYVNNILNEETFLEHNPLPLPNYRLGYAENAPLVDTIYAEHIPFTHNVALQHIKHVTPLVTAAEITQIPVAEIAQIPVKHGLIQSDFGHDVALTGVANIHRSLSAPIFVANEALAYYDQALPNGHLIPHGHRPIQQVTEIINVVPETPIPVISPVIQAIPIVHDEKIAVSVAPIAQVSFLQNNQHILQPSPIAHVASFSQVPHLTQNKIISQVLQPTPVTQVLLGHPNIVQQVPIVNRGHGQISHTAVVQNQQKQGQKQQGIHVQPAAHVSQISVFPVHQNTQFATGQSQYVQQLPVYNSAQGQIKQLTTRLNAGEVQQTIKNKPTVQFSSKASSSERQYDQKPPINNFDNGQITYADIQLNQGEVLLTKPPIKEKINGVQINSVPAEGTIQLSEFQTQTPQISTDYGAPIEECNCTRGSEMIIGLSPPQVYAYPSYSFLLSNPKTGSSSRQEVRFGNAGSSLPIKPSEDDIDATATTDPILDYRFSTNSGSTESISNQTTLSDVDPKDEKHRKSDGKIEE